MSLFSKPYDFKEKEKDKLKIEEIYKIIEVNE